MKKIFFACFCFFALISPICVFSQVTYNFTGVPQYWVVPSGVSTVSCTVKGAQGGGVNGGKGAIVTVTVSVIPGQVLEINVGGQGNSPTGGWNGGGPGQFATNVSDYSSGGGGASDIRATPYGLANRIIVAGGGGGTGGGNVDQTGGYGGCNAGANGFSTFGGEGFGGTQTAGGTGGPPWGPGGGAGANGILGIGGAGGADTTYDIGPGGGGGGGYYGGGGGGSDDWPTYPLGGGGGGGGSSFYPLSGICFADTNVGNGEISLAWNISSCTSTFATIDSVVPITSCTANDGAIYISDSTIAPPLTYQWSNGATTQDISGLPFGSYYVTVTDTFGCSVTISAYVSSPSLISISVDSTINVSCGANGGAIYVSLTGGNAPYTYNWSNGSTTQDITGLTNGIYTLFVIDSLGCSASISVSVQLPGSLASPAICMVTVDSLSQYNVIMWDKTQYQNMLIDSFVIYREITTNNYYPIGSVHYDSLSLFVDTVRTKYFPNTGDPNAGSYKYKLQMRDTCGSYSNLGLYHNTIFITSNSNGNFSWPQLYTIEANSNPVGAYVLMRDDSSNGKWNAINSVAGTQQSITDPAYNAWKNTASWRVQTIWNISCIPSRLNLQPSSTYNTSKSNLIKLVYSGIDDISENEQMNIFPSPFSDIINIQSSLKMSEIKIVNIFGEEVFVENINSNSFSINLMQSSGIYFMHVKTEKGHFVRKIVKQ